MAGLALSLAAAGCKAGPDYEAPDPEREAVAFSSADGREAEAAGIVAAQPVAREWWRTFKDEKLERLVEALVDENLDLRAAQARVREARGLRGIAAAPLYPQLDLGGRVGVAAPLDDRFHGGIAYNVGFDARWEIDVFGGLRRGLEAADATLEVAIESRRDVLVSLMGELARNYVELRGEQRQLAIAQSNVALQERTLQLLNVRLRAGLASELQITQATSLLETTRALVPTLEAACARSLFRLSVLLGKPPATLEAELAKPGPLPAIPATIPLGLSSELLKRRPDIRSAERNMAALTARLGVARADLYPKFALTGSIGLSSTYGIDGKPSFFVGPTIAWPIFNGGRIVSGIEVADARLAQAVLAYRSSVLRALEDVENTVTAFSKELVRRDTLARAATQARRATTLAQTQYRNGLVDFLNVLTAQAALAQTEQALVVSEQTLLVNLVAVYKALGGGWDVYDSRIEAREREDAKKS